MSAAFVRYSLPERVEICKATSNRRGEVLPPIASAGGLETPNHTS